MPESLSHSCAHTQLHGLSPVQPRQTCTCSLPALTQAPEEQIPASYTPPHSHPHFPSFLPYVVMVLSWFGCRAQSQPQGGDHTLGCHTRSCTGLLGRYLLSEPHPGPVRILLTTGKAAALCPQDTCGLSVHCPSYAVLSQTPNLLVKNKYLCFL